MLNKSKYKEEKIGSAMDNQQELYYGFFLGDKDAVLSVVSRYRDAIILFVNGYVKNFAAAEDIAGDTFVKLILSKPKIKNEAYFKTYLFAIAKNTAIDYLKKNKRELRAAETMALTAKAAEGAEDALLRTEKNEAVLRSILKLNEDYRSVLILHYYEDMTADEICKVMKRNKKQVYNLLHRAKEALKPLLAVEGIDNEDV